MLCPFDPLRRDVVYDDAEQNHDAQQRHGGGQSCQAGAGIAIHRGSTEKSKFNAGGNLSVPSYRRQAAVCEIVSIIVLPSGGLTTSPPNRPRARGSSVLPPPGPPIRATARIELSRNTCIAGCFRSPVAGIGLVSMGTIHGLVPGHQHLRRPSSSPRVLLSPRTCPNSGKAFRARTFCGSLSVVVRFGYNRMEGDMARCIRPCSHPFPPPHLPGRLRRRGRCGPSGE